MIKTIIISSDKLLINNFKESSQIEVVGSYSSFDSVLDIKQAEEGDLLIVSDRILENNISDGLGQITEKFNVSKVVYLLSNKRDIEEHQRVARYCYANDIHLIKPGRSVNDIIDEILTIVGADKKETKKGLIVSFTGTTPNIGTTFVALNTTIILSKRVDASILFLDLNLKSGKSEVHLGIDNPKVSIDAIFSEISSNNITNETFKRHSYHVNSNLDVITGTKERERAELFEINQIDYLLDNARKYYDIVIVDVNPYWDNAATFQTLIKSDVKLLLTTPDLSNFQHDLNLWVKKVGSDMGIEVKRFDLIVNQSGGTFNKRHISKETGMNVITEIPYYNEVRNSINLGEPILLKGSNHQLEKEIKPITELIIKLGNLVMIEDIKETKKTGILALIGGKQ